MNAANHKPRRTLTEILEGVSTKRQMPIQNLMLKYNEKLSQFETMVEHQGDPNAGIDADALHNVANTLDLMQSRIALTFIFSASPSDKNTIANYTQRTAELIEKAMDFPHKDDLLRNSHERALEFQNEQNDFFPSETSH